MWKWNNRKMAYVSVLIAASVTFVIVGSRLMAITTIPSFKVAFGGLPIKLTGFMFGPIVGMITGIISDLLSFAFLPTFYHPGYTLTMALSGFVPGVIFWLMIQRQKRVHTYFWATFAVLAVIMIGLFFLFTFLPDSILFATGKGGKEPLITKRWIYQVITIPGFAVLMVALVVAKFKLKGIQFYGFAGIIMFSAILEVLNAGLVPLWDQSALKIPYSSGFVLHLLWSPFKIIGNVMIIYLTWRIVYPLVSNKSKNTYDAG